MTDLIRCIEGHIFEAAKGPDCPICGAPTSFAMDTAAPNANAPGAPEPRPLVAIAEGIGGKAICGFAAEQHLPAVSLPKLLPQPGSARAETDESRARYSQKHAKLTELSVEAFANRARSAARATNNSDYFNFAPRSSPKKQGLIDHIMQRLAAGEDP